MKILLISLFLLCSIILCHSRAELDIIVEWKQVEYDFSSFSSKTDALNSGLYIPANSFPVDVDVDYRGSFFIALTQ